MFDFISSRTFNADDSEYESTYVGDRNAVPVAI